MVVNQLTDEEIDRLFHALADATRRDIVVRAAAGDLSVSGLARDYPVSVTAITFSFSITFFTAFPGISSVENNPFGKPASSNTS